MGSALLAFWLYLPLAALALLGIVCLYIGLFFDRGKSRRRCPKCWYDMSGAPPTPPVRCPECGHVARTERELARRRRRWWLAALGYMLMAPLLVFFALRDGPRAYYSIMPKWKLKQDIRVNNTRAARYTIRNPTERGGRFILSSNNRTILDVEDSGIDFVQEVRTSTRGFGYAPRGVAEDIDGNGTLDLVVLAYSGGAHCCYTVYIIELSDPPRVAATIDARNGMSLQSAPTATNPKAIEFNIPDQSFDYWNASHAESPFLSVCYRLENGSLRIALDRMIKTFGAVLEHRADTRSHRTGPLQLDPVGTGKHAPPKLDTNLWSSMLDLLYSGNEPECWAYFDTNWPANFAGPPTKDAFKQEFLSLLSKSPQWQDFQAARAAVAKGKPIPPATVGNYKPQPLSSPTSPP